ncbi:uncharacterized protein LOC144337398 [Macaca mulatta]
MASPSPQAPGARVSADLTRRVAGEQVTAADLRERHCPKPFLSLESASSPEVIAGLTSCTHGRTTFPRILRVRDTCPRCREPPATEDHTSQGSVRLRGPCAQRVNRSRLRKKLNRLGLSSQSRPARTTRSVLGHTVVLW